MYDVDMRHDYEKLPRKVARKHRCQALTESGDQCRDMAEWQVDAHLDQEIYSDGINWIMFYLCTRHWLTQWLWVDKNKATVTTSPELKTPKHKGRK